MKTPIAVLAFVAVTVASSTAQQSPSSNPQAQPPQTQPAPCTTAAPKPSKFHLKVPPRFAPEVAKIQGKIYENTGVYVDPNDILNAAKAAKPCQPAPQVPPSAPPPPTQPAK